MAQDPTTGPGDSGAGPEGGPPPAGEVQVDGNTLASDGAGNMTFDGADGSHAEMGADGSASFQGPEGSGISGEMNPDGSGSWTGPDGTTTSWEAGEEAPNDLPGMEALPDMGAIAQSPEAVEAFGEPPPGMMDGEPGMGPGPDAGPPPGMEGGPQGPPPGEPGGPPPGMEGGPQGPPPGEPGMGALDGALGGDHAGGDMPPPPTDDPLGAALDNAAAQSDAGSSGGQAPAPDPMADMPADPGMDSDMPKPEEEDQGGGALG